VRFWTLNGTIVGWAIMAMFGMEGKMPRNNFHKQKSVVTSEVSVILWIVMKFEITRSTLSLSMRNTTSKDQGPLDAAASCGYFHFFGVQGLRIKQTLT
jgi:hypothetical protein